MKVKNLIWICISCIIILIIFNSIFLLSNVINNNYFNGNDNMCSNSQYNTYTNSTDATFLLGKCYVESRSSYTTSYECKGGFMGFGSECKEYNEPINKIKSKTICFKLKNGERC